MTRRIRAPVVSGIFYPLSPDDLAEAIDKLLDAATTAGKPDREAECCSAIISPHGSLGYSGTIAAKAWKAVSRRAIRTIVLLSPSHRNFETGIFMPEADAFQLPTATFAVDRDSVQALLHSSTCLNISDIPHFEEHSIEMQLIFAARWFSRAQIVPIIVCGADDGVLDGLFAHLYCHLQDRIASTLLVMTTNLAVDTNADECLRLSASFVEALEKNDAHRLSTLSATRPSFCGGSIIAAYLRSAFYSGRPPIVLGVGSSVAQAEIGDPIVGYGALGFPE